MCGIAGFVDTRGGISSHLPVERMTDSIRHRGPDARGFFKDPWVALGHRRLSIIDARPPVISRWPMKIGSLQIIYNGEIYNHASLRPELERAGHTLHHSLRYRDHSARL